MWSKIKDTIWPSVVQDILSMKNWKFEPQSGGFYVLQDWAIEYAELEGTHKNHWSPTPVLSGHPQE